MLPADRKCRGDLGAQDLGGGYSGTYQTALAGCLHRPPHPPRLPDMGYQGHRRDLLEVFASCVPHLAGMAVHRGPVRLRKPDRRPEVVDVGVRQQDRGDVARPVPQSLE